MPNLPTEAASDVCSIAHQRAATKQTARKAAAHPGFDDMAPSAALLALRICTSYSTRLAPCIRGHLVRNAAHEGFCISLLVLREGVDVASGERARDAAIHPPCGERLGGPVQRNRARRERAPLAACDKP